MEPTSSKRSSSKSVTAFDNEPSTALRWLSRNRRRTESGIWPPRVEGLSSVKDILPRIDSCTIMYCIVMQNSTRWVSQSYCQSESCCHMSYCQKVKSPSICFLSTRCRDVDEVEVIWKAFILFHRHLIQFSTRVSRQQMTLLTPLRTVTLVTILLATDTL